MELLPSFFPYDAAFTGIPKRVFVIENVMSGDKMVNNLRSNHVLLIRNCTDTRFIFFSNMRLTSIVIQNCLRCRVVMLDSTVITSGIIRVVDSVGCEFTFEDVTVPRLKCTG